MKHPNEATLALHAGGDLGAFARWRTQRHLAKCERCREELAAFDATREIVGGLAEIPELPWSQLEAEMKANIRLGLSAGECVRGAEPAAAQNGFDLSWFDLSWIGGARALAAGAMVAVLVATGLLLERSRPHPAPAPGGVVVENTPNGIQMSDGGQALSLMNTGAQSVVYSPSAGGTMGARYVDPKTGYVTVNNLDLYAQ
jgi:hypothetical protein